MHWVLFLKHWIIVFLRFGLISATVLSNKLNNALFNFFAHTVALMRPRLLQNINDSVLIFKFCNIHYLSANMICLWLSLITLFLCVCVCAKQRCINKAFCRTTKLDIHRSSAKPTAILSYNQSISGDHESDITHTRNCFMSSIHVDCYSNTCISI